MYSLRGVYFWTV